MRKTTRKGTGRRRWIHALVTALIAVAALFLLLRQISWRSIPSTLAQIPVTMLLATFALYLLLVFTKAWRFQLILQLPVSPRRLFPILAIQTFWTSVLPMRTGDLSYVYLLRRRENVSTSKGLASLMVGSLIDLLLLFALLVGLGGIFYARIRGHLPMVTLLLIPTMGFFALLGFWLVLGSNPRRAERWLEWFRKRIEPSLARMEEASGWGARLLARGSRWFFEQITRLLTELIAGPRGMQLLKVLGVSFLAMLLRFSLQWLLIHGMQIQFAWSEVFFALAFTGFCNLFPIQSVAGLGAVEAPWTWALINLGKTMQDAVVAGFSLHITVLLYSAGAGGIGWLLGSRGVRGNHVSEGRRGNKSSSTISEVGLNELGSAARESEKRRAIE